MPFCCRGVSALRWVTDKRTSLELGHVPRLALTQHTGQCVTIRGTSSGFLCMFHNTSVFARTFDERRFQVFFCPVARSTVFGPMQDSQLHCSLWDGVSSVPSSSARMISSGGKVPCGFALSAAPRVGVSTLRGMERQHTHQVYFERLLFGEAGQLLRVERHGSRRSTPSCLLAASFWSRRASLVLLSLLVFPRPVFLWPLSPLIQFLA